MHLGYGGCSIILVILILQCSGASVKQQEHDSDIIRRTKRHDGEQQLLISEREMQMDKDNRVKMGVPNPECDDGEFNLQMDWLSNQTSVYTCLDDTNYTQSEEDFDFFCETGSIPMPQHICMTDPISYKDTPPTSGSHRPLWPKYGVYGYCPPQRWTHSLEHGAVVMLYDPCCDEEERNKLKELVQSCLYRYIITPYKGMPKPLALVTYGCRLLMDKFDEERASNFIIEHAKKGIEQLAEDGQYDLGLEKGAEPLSDSDITDECLCPAWNKCEKKAGKEEGEKGEE